jgi:hypothetical protein
LKSYKNSYIAATTKEILKTKRNEPGLIPELIHK